MPRGGKRVGAGRPAGTGKYGVPTYAARIPITLQDEFQEWLNSFYPDRHNNDAQLDKKVYAQNKKGKKMNKQEYKAYLIKLADKADKQCGKSDNNDDANRYEGMADAFRQAAELVNIMEAE